MITQRRILTIMPSANMQAAFASSSFPVIYKWKKIDDIR